MACRAKEKEGPSQRSSDLTQRFEASVNHIAMNAAPKANAMSMPTPAPAKILLSNELMRLTQGRMADIPVF